MVTAVHVLSVPSLCTPCCLLLSAVCTSVIVKLTSFLQTIDPPIVGCSVFGTDDIHSRLTQFIERRRADNDERLLVLCCYIPVYCCL